MQAVLYVGHGSRISEGNKQLISFVQKAMLYIKARIQEICFIELATPTISEGIETCVRRGATKIAVVPVLLLSAGHVKIDIPGEIAQGKQRFPHIDFSYGRPFGIHDSIISILAERLGEQGLYMNEHGTQQDITVLLVGRGSSDPGPKNDLCIIGSLLLERYPIKHVEVCYLAAAEPNFEQGIEKVLQLDQTKILVLPYLLFTGMLMKKMKRVMEQYKNDCKDKEMVLCDYLGFHPKLVNVLVERVEELTRDCLSDISLP